MPWLPKPPALIDAMADDDPERNRQALTELLARCALRDRTAFLSLYQATSAKLFGVAIRILKGEAWAEEAVQEAFLKVWRNARQYDPTRGTPMTWMINVVRNEALDLRRSAQFRHAQQAVELDDGLPADAGPLEATETDSALERLRRCMQPLAKEQRACILLVYHQGFTPTEVSRRNGWPLGTVKTWIRRGLERIRTCMDQ